MHGHLAHDYPNTSTQSQNLGSSNASSIHGNSFKSGQQGTRRGRGWGRQVRFGASNVLYDEEGNEYPMDNIGLLYVPLEFEPTIV